MVVNVSAVIVLLIAKGVKDLKPTHHLSATHVDVQGIKRVNVRLAVQLLSETTAEALHYFGANHLLECKTWHETSEFISLADNWFDVFNSRKVNDMKSQEMHLV